MWGRSYITGAGGGPGDNRRSRLSADITCTVCGGRAYVHNVSTGGLHRWSRGEDPYMVLPYVSGTDLATLRSGRCPECRERIRLDALPEDYQI